MAARSRSIRSSTLTGFCLLGLSICTPAYAKDSVPDWVRAAIAQPLPNLPKTADAVILLDDTTLSVGKDGRAVEHERRVVKILRPAGREEGFVSVAFDKDTKLLSLHIWSVGPDGHEYAMKDNEIVERGDPGGGNLYEDVKFKVANPPGRDPGGVVAYEFERRSRPYINEENWVFQENIPAIEESFTLELPEGYTYKSVWAHHDALSTIDLEHQRWRWQATNVPAIDLQDVPLHPPSSSMRGRLTVHYGPASSAELLATWQQIGQWYAGLSNDRLQASPEIAAKAAELTAGKTDFFDKSEAIGEFVQKQVRYFVIERGIGGFQPHPAQDIFHNRYGDCKDKATLLTSMLSTVGIHGALVMVDTHRGAIDPEAPSNWGNHMIAAIQIPDGYTSPRLRSVVTAKSGKRYLIFDPTWERTAFGQLESNLQGSYGVLVEGAASELIPLPVLAPETNTVSRSASFQLSSTGELEGSVTEKRFGDLSEYWRGVYNNRDEKDQTALRNSVLGRDFSGFTTTDWKVENVNALNKDLTTSYGLKADHFGKTVGTLIMVRPRVFGTDGIRVDRKPRTVPIDLDDARLEKDEFSIEIPQGYKVDELPDPVKLDLGFAAYESLTSVKGNRLVYTRTYTVRQVSLPASKYAELQKLSAVIDADEKTSAVLKKQ